MVPYQCHIKMSQEPSEPRPEPGSPKDAESFGVAEGCGPEGQSRVNGQLANSQEQGARDYWLLSISSVHVVRNDGSVFITVICMGTLGVAPTSL